MKVGPTQGGTAITTQPKPTTREAGENARHFAIEAARALANTRCSNVVCLEVSHISPVTDYLVIGTGTSARQMRSVCDDVQELGEAQGYRPLSTCGYEGENWVLVDFVDVVVHVFSEDARLFYDLDSLWGDGRRIEWRTEEQQKQQAQSAD